MSCTIQPLVSYCSTCSGIYASVETLRKIPASRCNDESHVTLSRNGPQLVPRSSCSFSGMINARCEVQSPLSGLGVTDLALSGRCVLTVMDPVTGISLTASVLHLLKFSIDTVTTIREVYEQGSIGRYNDLNETTGRLEECTRSLQQSLQNSNPPSSALAKEDKELLELGRKCEKCAQELQHQLRKLQSQPRSSVMDAMKGVARAVWKKDKIERIDKQLKTYQSILDTSLLLRLGYVPLSVQDFSSRSCRVHTT